MTCRVVMRCIVRLIQKQESASNTPIFTLRVDAKKTIGDMEEGTHDVHERASQFAHPDKNIPVSAKAVPNRTTAGMCLLSEPRLELKLGMLGMLVSRFLIWTHRW